MHIHPNVVWYAVGALSHFLLIVGLGMKSTRFRNAMDISGTDREGTAMFILLISTVWSLFWPIVDVIMMVKFVACGIVKIAILAVSRGLPDLNTPEPETVFHQAIIEEPKKKTKKDNRTRFQMMDIEKSIMIVF